MVILIVTQLNPSIFMSNDFPIAKLKVLLVQDIQTQGSGTRDALISAGYRVFAAVTGASALSLAMKESIEIIIIDVALPDTEGGDLCRQFRRTMSTSNIPVMMLAGRGHVPSVKKPFDGPDDYLAKPFGEGELQTRISAVLHTKKLENELELKNRLLDETLAKVGELAIIDPETGLYNRRQFEVMFRKEFKRALRYKQPVSCMRISLDGREEGPRTEERIIKSIIKLIQNTIREVDTAAWWSGDGFIVMIPNTTREQGLHAAARILVAVADHPFTWSDAANVKVSIGVAGVPDDTIETEAKLIESAEAALEQAKQFMVKPHAITAEKSFTTSAAYNAGHKLFR
jgi:two-component system cell cycle response regulator